MIPQKILDELSQFISENPNCDTAEIAEHFYNVGYNAHVEEEKERKRLVDALPGYYGN